MKDIKPIREVSRVFASTKRLVILSMLEKGPMCYTDIKGDFEKLRLATSSYEIYQHLHKLLEFDYIAKKGKQYLITSKGLKALRCIDEIANEEPRLPKVRWEF